MENDICQCPNCGRSHKPFGFGTPPEGIAHPHAKLMQFYGVSTVSDLIEAQDKSIARLQEDLRRLRPEPLPQRRVREG